MFLKKDVNVLVSEPRTSILGTQELFIEAGSTINLTCVIQTGGQPMASSHIYWNYNGKVSGERLSISIAPRFRVSGTGGKKSHRIHASRGAKWEREFWESENHN